MLSRATWPFWTGTVLTACVFFSSPSHAQTMGMTPLSLAAAQNLRTSLIDSIRSAKGNDGFIKTAISQTILRAVASNGPDSAASIASNVITLAEIAGASSAQIGTAMASASVTLAPESCKGDGGNPILDCRVAATAIAQTIAIEGRVEEVIAYQIAAIELTYPKLARIAGRWQAPVGAINPGAGGNLGAGFGGGFVGGAGASGGCLTASCTHL